MLEQGRPSQEAAMDRQFILAATVALTLAAIVKVLAPIETAALTQAAKAGIPAMTSVQPDTKWLVAP